MTTLSFREIEEIRDHIDALPGPVNLIMIKDTAMCDECHELEKFAQELTMVSHNFRFEALSRASDPSQVSRYKVDIAPVLIINGIAGGRIRFFGVPTTSEFSTFLKTIKDVAHGKLELSSGVRHQFSNLRKPVHIRILVPSTCIFCPDIVAAAEKLAFSFSQVTVDIVNLKDFPELAKHHHVQFQSKVLVNDRDIAFDPSSENAFAESVLRPVS